MKTRRTRKLTTACLLFALYPSTGLAGDGVVALQTGDPPCRDGSGNTYVACGNGTVTDNRTGLVWLQNTSCFGVVDWHSAMAVVAGLADLPGSDPDDCGLSDGSSPGEWRLPSKAEWEVMTADASSMSCSPAITNDAGNGCWSPTCASPDGCSFTGVQASAYWSSSTIFSDPTFVWAMLLGFGDADGDPKAASSGHVWPIRGGQ